MIKKLQVTVMSEAEADAIIAESKQLDANRANETRSITDATKKRVQDSKEDFGSLKNPFCDIPQGVSTQYEAFKQYASDKAGSDKLKIFDIQNGEKIGSKNGLKNAIIIRMSLPARDGVLMSETVIFGTNSSGTPTILALSDDGTVGNSEYEKVFFESVTDLKGQNLTEYGSENIEFNVKQDISLENGFTVIEQKYGESKEFIDKSGKVVENGDVLVNGKKYVVKKNNKEDEYLANEQGEKVTEEEIKNIEGETCKGDSCKTTNISRSIETIKSNPEWINIINKKENSKLLKNAKNFHTSYTDGLKYAKKNKQDVVIIAMQENCTYCEKLYENVINTKEFVKYAKDKTIIFQPAKYLETAEKKVLQDFGGTVPAILAISKNDYNIPKWVSNGYSDKKIYTTEITNILNSE